MTHSLSSNTSSLTITRQEDGTQLVSGNTFPIKDILKQNGGRWDAGRKAWIMPQNFDASTLPAPTPAQSGTRSTSNRIFPLVDNAGDDDNFGETPITTQAASSSQARGEVKLISSVNTFKVKDQIVKAGGRWKADTKQWEVPVDFDMNIIPVSQPKAASDGTSGTTKGLRVIHCSLCGAEGHAKNRCQCSHCGAIGIHCSDKCPTINPRWKYLIGSAIFRCQCSPTNLCLACANVCCRDARPLPCNCSLKTECSTHGTNCHGEHPSDSTS